ncbi:HlyD family type I secretion periplasmic adaptor subunit [Janthinobacterium sp. PAMC25594]|uniref:HlyD family type I secretion periplasmic adaptor subunit n=1 Tax=Janthinobacterium sp. PAMC25594 TaxID=2861284 RepID=UPI001C6328EE|nr:HlyD family type I secretion periplasmic adaptor subunit [Janthinobacterium sp. PAMC25594]QYG09828.1 HlyD family type I secretion periplasmic adaptor subunit [Janthinobacterium sp. PAMC25594]
MADPAKSQPAQRVDVADIADAELPRSHDWLQGAVLCLTAAAIAWCCWGETDVVSTAQGKIIPEGQIKMLQSPENAIITAIHVREGAHVKQGDVLIELDPSVSSADVASLTARTGLLVLEIARISAEIGKTEPRYPVVLGNAALVALQEQLRLARQSTHAARISQLDADVENAQNTEAMVRGLIVKLNESLADAHEQEERFRPYVGLAIPMVTYMATKDALLAKERELLTQQAKLRSTATDLKNLTQKRRQLLGEQQSQLMTELYDKQRELGTLQAELEKSSRSLRIKVLRAPIDGFVQNLSVTTLGGVVTPAQNLVSVVPENAPLVVEAYLANADIGFAKVGQTVAIKVDAYPYMQYGEISGVLNWVSPDADSQPANVGAERAAAQAAGSMYRIRASTNGQRLKTEAEYVLKPGMSVHVDIKTDRRTFLRLFMQPLLRYWKDAVQQR